MKLNEDFQEHPFTGIVEIDESQFGKRKNNVGRIGTTDWFFGICDAEPEGRVYITKVDCRDTATLLPIIQSLIEPDTIIMSDGWASYNDLDDEGYPIWLSITQKNLLMQPLVLTRSESSLYWEQQKNG
jgi:transposase